jgi:acyl carrier protein
MALREAPSRAPGPSAPAIPSDIPGTLRRLIQENAGIPASLVRDDSTIDGDLAMDSFSFISLQVAVEDEFGIVCDPAEIEACKRFDAIVALVRDKVDAENEAARTPARRQPARRASPTPARKKAVPRSRTRK